MTGPSLVLLGGVRWRGEPVVGGRSQALLAALAGAAPRPLPYDVLVEQVWSEEPPDHPDKALQVLVSRTRARTAADAIEHTGTGYRLGLAAADVDVLELRRLVAEAGAAEAAGDLDLARMYADSALAVPVGEAVDDPVTGELAVVARAEIGTARRIAAAAALGAGDHRRALDLLEPLAAERPGDEALLAMLLRAEAAVRGVPAALGRYASYAESTRERLGVDPGEQLRRVHLELLAREAPVREGLTYDAVPMVGRDHDVAAIRMLLERARVVSIVGPGGLGKTRMAHLVGHLAEQPVVRLVELAGVTAPESVLPEVATALGVRDAVTQVVQAGWIQDLRGRVVQQLSGAPTLLVLDNCEHLVDVVADLVAFLVATVPDLRVVTTSRSPLGIAAEQVYQLPQLDPDAAVQLFRQRATAARPGVRLDDAEVRRLVARLDGLPLAIELAAAKVRAMSVGEVLRRLTDRFALLRGGDRSAPDRHRTLEAVIEWSWQLLPTSPQEALRELSIFPDGFSLAAAEDVLGRDALTDISHLAEQSLVVVREDDAVRYRFLETVREYAAQRLDEAGDREAVGARLDRWAARFSREQGAELRGPGQVGAMASIREEVGNLSGVLRRAIECQDHATVVPVIASLTNFWTIQGEHTSVLGVAEAVLDLLADYETLGATDTELDELRLVLADLSAGIAILSSHPPKRSIEQLRQLGPGPVGTVAHAISRVVLTVFDSDAQGLGMLEELAADPDPTVARTALVWLIQLLENSGEAAQALATARRATQLPDPESGPWLRAMVEAQLAHLAMQTGDVELALASAERALPTLEALGAHEDAFQMRTAIAMVEVGRGNLDRASAIVEEIAADERARRSLGWSFALIGLAEVALARGETERGLDLYREAVDSARSRRYPELSMDVSVTPWVLFMESAALHAHLLHDPQPAAAVRDLAASLSGRMSEVLSDEFQHLDVPILGKVLVAVGTWLLDRDDPDLAPLRMLALGERFGHYRGIPIGSWDHAASLAEGRAPGELDRLRGEYAGRAAADLLGDARSVAAWAAEQVAYSERL